MWQYPFYRVAKVVTKDYLGLQHKILLRDIISTDIILRNPLNTFPTNVSNSKKNREWRSNEHECNDWMNSQSTCKRKHSSECSFLTRIIKIQHSNMYYNENQYHVSIVYKGGFKGGFLGISYIKIKEKFNIWKANQSIYVDHETEDIYFSKNFIFEKMSVIQYFEHKFFATS